MSTAKLDRRRAEDAFGRTEGYVCGRALATVVFLSLKLGRPLFLEGEAGVGKTEIAKALAAGLGASFDPTTVLRRP